jgi:hypothetical protein
MGFVYFVCMYVCTMPPASQLPKGLNNTHAIQYICSRTQLSVTVTRQASRQAGRERKDVLRFSLLHVLCMYTPYNRIPKEPTLPGLT